MRIIKITVTALSLAAAAWAPQLMAAEKNAARPVEVRTCSFRDGKSMKDLDQVLVSFREYANRNNTGYAAWILTPEYQKKADYDFAWMGSWPDGIAYGVSMEKWKAAGNTVLPQIAQVVTCGDHEMFMSQPINAPDGTPEDGILLAYACTLKDGKTLADAYKAHLEFGQTMKAKGSLSVSWFFTPAAGMGDSTVDYYHMVAFYRYSDLGDTMEMFVNRGGVETRHKLIDPVASCLTPDVYDAVSVRAHDERS